MIILIILKYQALVCVCGHVHMTTVPRNPGDGTGTPAAGVTDNCEQLPVVAGN